MTLKEQSVFDAMRRALRFLQDAMTEGDQSDFNYAIARCFEALAAAKEVQSEQVQAVEPVAWMTHHEEPLLFPTRGEAQEFCDYDEEPIPLYTHPAPPPVSEPGCNPHPDAPHGFNRNASHAAGRYVCDCEGWVPEHKPDWRSA